MKTFFLFLFLSLSLSHTHPHTLIALDQSTVAACAAFLGLVASPGFQTIPSALSMNQETLPSGGGNACRPFDRSRARATFWTRTVLSVAFRHSAAVPS